MKLVLIGRIRQIQTDEGAVDERGRIAELAIEHPMIVPRLNPG
jgi:hypothetical protein